MSARRLVLAFCLLAAACAENARGPGSPDVRFEPSPMEVVRQMLDLGGVRPGDTVYDLGCGDGRIVVEAAKRGARGVCVDIDPKRIAEARANAAREGVGARIEFRTEDLMSTPLGGASVVMLFLSHDMNLKLRPKLRAELAPGARVVSHWHRMGDWEPERAVVVRGPYRNHEVFLWTMRP